MVVCDGFWRDPYTGKHTLIGTFSALGGGPFPLMHPVLTVYVSLTNGHGQTKITLRLVDAEEEREPLLEMEQEIDFSDPRMVCEICFQATGIIFPQPGEHRLRLFADGQFVIERRIDVLGAESDAGD